MTRTRLMPQIRCLLTVLLACSLVSAQAIAEEGGYLIEVLVFQHLDSTAEPEAVLSVRGFHDVPRVDERLVGEAPSETAFLEGSFDSLWRRLSRLGSYRPLTRMAWVQSRMDYHPAVRLHNDEVIAEQLYFPGNVIYVDLTQDDMMRPFVKPLYRLDGTIQLRRSRFLHIDLDLEFRVDDPAWAEAFPPIVFDEEEFVEPEPDLDLFAQSPDDPEAVPEPFRIHRLRQSRQVRSGSVQYFDSPTLGALVRVTRTASPAVNR